MKIVKEFDAKVFEESVNGYCCNCDMKVLSATALPFEGLILYIAFLVDRGRYTEDCD